MIPIIFPSSSKHKFCHLCGRALIGSYTRYSTGLVVCPQCQQSAPRCDHCHQPARDPLKVDHQQFCKTCLAQLPRCGACGKPISGQFYRFGDSSQPYCPTCTDQLPHCGVCGAPVGKSGQRLSGGQYRCGECSRTLVTDEQSVHDLYRAVIKEAETILNITVQQIPNLIIAEPAQLAAVRHTYGDPEPSAPESSGQHVVGFFAQQGSSRTIYVEYGLPRANLIGTLAHEYAHAWQADHAPSPQTELMREGFAEWVSYRMLVALGHTREAARATRREDLYGRGLRYFVTLEQESGRQQVFAEAVAHRAKLP